MNVLCGTQSKTKLRLLQMPQRVDCNLINVIFNVTLDIAVNLYSFKMMVK